MKWFESLKNSIRKRKNEDVLSEWTENTPLRRHPALKEGEWCIDPGISGITRVYIMVPEGTKEEDIEIIFARDRKGVSR